jgi:acyl carrier protein
LNGSIAAGGDGENTCRKSTKPVKSRLHDLAGPGQHCTAARCEGPEYLMNNDLEMVRAFLKERLDIDPQRVAPTATLEELEIDSLVLLELFFEFEQKAGLSLAKDIPTPKTIGELLGIVKRLQTATAAG